MRNVSKSRICIRCGHCNGTGRLEFAGKHADTLALLKRQPEPINGSTLAKLAGCRNEAMCNRLRYLEKQGLATSKRYGRERHWTAV